MSSPENGVFYTEHLSDDAVNAILRELNSRGLELVAVVPKIESPLVGLAQTVGLWIFWRRHEEVRGSES